MSKSTKSTKKTNKTDKAKAVCTCRKCGETLTEDNCRSPELFYCVDCEGKAFEELERENGTSLAFYLACARFDLPLYPLLISDEKGTLKEQFIENENENKWLVYLDLLDESDKLYINNRMATFQDGETKLLRIFGRDYSEKNFAKFVKFETERLAQLPGTELQRLTWGERPLYQNVPMTTEIYNELDRRYESRMARLKGITVDDQLIDTQRKLCKMLLAQDHLLSLGDVAAFDKLQKSIDSIQAAEQLRKKDEKPTETYSFDTQIKALEDAGLVEDGKFLDLEGVQKGLLQHFIKKQKYDYSVDVLDHVIEDIWNTMRANADVMMSTELPETLKPKDIFGELSKDDGDGYKKAKEFAGLTKVQYAKKK